MNRLPEWAERAERKRAAVTYLEALRPRWQQALIRVARVTVVGLLLLATGAWFASLLLPAPGTTVARPAAALKEVSL